MSYILRKLTLKKLNTTDMKEHNALEKIQTLLDGSGIKVNGPNPWDVVIKNNFASKAYHRFIRYGSLGLGEAYQDGWWDTQDPEELAETFKKILGARLDQKSRPWRIMIPIIVNQLIFNAQNRWKIKKIKEPYELSPKLYEIFLDKNMQYTCAYYKNTENLDEAQEQKLRLNCEKLKISEGNSVLDIGCGWGFFAKYVAENYPDTKVTGITISKEQYEYAKNLTKDFPQVTIKLMDYRKLAKQKTFFGPIVQYDKIHICGMLEHVGKKNYRKLFKIVSKCLKKDGLFLLHTICGFESTNFNDAWINKYVFPNGMLPSAEQITKAANGLFAIEDLHDFGLDYDKTLVAWYKKLKANWNQVKSEYYNESFFRTYKYYFLSCAGAFRCGNKNKLNQFVFSKGRPIKYETVR